MNKLSKQIMTLINESSGEIDGMSVTGPLFNLYHEVNSLVDKFNLSPSAMQQVIRDVIGHTPHSKGVEIEIRNYTKSAKASVSKLPGDAKYLKRNKDNATEEERQVEFLKYLKTVLAKEDGESFEGKPKFHGLILGEVANSLSAISDVLKALGNESLASSVSKAETEISKIAKHTVDQDDVYKTLKSLNMNQLSKEIAGAFKEADSKGQGVKLGRKEVKLTEVLKLFATRFQSAIKDLVGQGLDVSKVR